MPASNLGDCGHDLSGHTHSPAIVVSSHVVGDDSEEWRQCCEATACPGFEAISNSLDMATEVAERDGQARARSAERSSRSR